MPKIGAREANFIVEAVEDILPDTTAAGVFQNLMNVTAADSATTFDT